MEPTEKSPEVERLLKTLARSEEQPNLELEVRCLPCEIRRRLKCLHYMGDCAVPAGCWNLRDEVLLKEYAWVQTVKVDPQIFTMAEQEMKANDEWEDY